MCGSVCIIELADEETHTHTHTDRRTVAAVRWGPEYGYTHAEPQRTMRCRLSRKCAQPRNGNVNFVLNVDLPLCANFFASLSLCFAMAAVVVFVFLSLFQYPIEESNSRGKNRTRSE